MADAAPGHDDAGVPPVPSRPPAPSHPPTGSLPVVSRQVPAPPQPSHPPTGSIPAVQPAVDAPAPASGEPETPPRSRPQEAPRRPGLPSTQQLRSAILAVPGVAAVGQDTSRALEALRGITRQDTGGVVIAAGESEVAVDVSVVADLSRPVRQTAAAVQHAVQRAVQDAAETTARPDAEPGPSAPSSPGRLTEVNVDVLDVVPASDATDPEPGTPQPLPGRIRVSGQAMTTTARLVAAHEFGVDPTSIGVHLADDGGQLALRLTMPLQASAHAPAYRTAMSGRAVVRKEFEQLTGASLSRVDLTVTGVAKATARSAASTAGGAPPASNRAPGASSGERDSVPARAALNARIARREVGSHRSGLSVAVALLLALLLGYLGLEAATHAVGHEAWLLSPAEAWVWLTGLPASTNMPGLVAVIGGAVVLLGVAILAAALAPGHRRRRPLASARAAAVIDDDVVADSLVRAAQLGAGVGAGQARVAVDRGQAFVTIRPTSGLTVDSEAVRRAVEQEVRDLGLGDDLRVRVSVTTTGVVGQ